MLSSSNGSSIFPFPMVIFLLLGVLSLIFPSLKFNFFIVLLGYFWVFLTIIAVVITWKKYGFEESKGMGIVMLFCFLPYLLAVPTSIDNSMKEKINVYKEYTQQKIKNYQPCQEQDCHQSFILDDDKNRKYQVEITEQCVTMRPLHNYDFLYYEAKKCGDEITEKEYHSTAKFLKNVATLNFGSVFNAEQSNGK
ncbi:MAG: hypothetical protein J6V99_06365 [Neisseriaceae bacterium]|nr:hypothetical protein [Neisseriaceae bacterium]